MIKKYFTYNNEYISGWTYLLRILLSGVLLILFVVPGVYFASITAYKRSMSLKWPKEMVWVTTILIGFLPIINLIPDELAGDFLYVSLPISIIHLFLLFSNGLKKEIDN